MDGIDWYDVAPAVLFAIAAAGLARFIGGKRWRWVLLGFGYMLVAGLMAAAAVAFWGLSGPVGFAGSVGMFGILIVPLWMHVNASERTPVSEAEVDETIAASREFATDLANGKTNGELSKRAEVVLGHLDNILWRLAEDAPRRAELTGAKDHLRNSLRVRGGSEQVSDES